MPAEIRRPLGVMLGAAFLLAAGFVLASAAAVPEPSGGASPPAISSATPEKPAPPAPSDSDLPPAARPGPRLPPDLLRNRPMSPPMSDREEPASDEEASARLAEMMPSLQKASE